MGDSFSDAALPYKQITSVKHSVLSSEKAARFNMLVFTCLPLMWLMHTATSYKILVQPMTVGFTSRLLNMQKMADMLADDSHDVYLLINHKIRKYVIAEHVKIIEYRVPEETAVLETFEAVQSFQLNWEVFEQQSEFFLDFSLQFFKSLMNEEKLLEQLRKENFDLILGDLFDASNAVLASHLNVNLLLYQNHGFFPEFNAFYPILPGMNCVFQGMGCINDNMGFYDKLMNLYMSYRMVYYIFPKYHNAYATIADQSGIVLHYDIKKVYQEGVVLATIDFFLDEPRPLMPHVFPISGLFHKKPSPLPQDLENFIAGSSPHGVVVLSFGTLVTGLSKDVANMFARVFSRLQQRVIWRFKGELALLGKNTKLVDWFPQNDVLGHPLVRVFITHCGSSGTFEAIYNGVPVVAVPLFAEQVFNAAKLIQRGKMGRQIDIFNVTEAELQEVLHDVLTNEQYKINAKHASRIMSDQPIPPRHKFLHLVNFTIRTNGAKHLFHERGIHMTWYQLLGLDVLVTALALAISAIFVSLVLLYFIMKWFLLSKIKKE